MTASQQQRRRLLAAMGMGLAGSAAGVLAACGSSGSGSGGARGTLTGTTTVLQPGGTGGSADVAILNSSLDLENMAVAAYEAVVPELTGAALAMGRRVLDQEREHADGLTDAIRQLGGTPNQPKARYGFPALRGRKQALSFATQIENTAIAAYLDSLPRLSSPDLRGTAASIITDEAEHLSVLEGALGRQQLTGAFVTGAA